MINKIFFWGRKYTREKSGGKKVADINVSWREAPLASRGHVIFVLFFSVLCWNSMKMTDYLHSDPLRSHYLH